MLPTVFHTGCPAEDPSGAGPRSHGSDHLLRAICVMAMAPTRLLTPDLIEARVRAYELDQFIGGTVGKLYFEGEDCILPGYVEENRDTPNVRNFDDAPEEVKDLVDPFWRGEDAAEGLRALQEMLMTAPARL